MTADTTENSLNNDIAKGAGWMLALRLALKSVSIVSTIILARLLLPDDFGVYALSMSIFGFIELVRAFGFGMALIQNQNATRDHYDTAWTLHLMFSFIAGTALFLLSGPLSGYLNEPRLLNAIRFLSLIFIVDAFANIGIINFQKEMNFDKEFKRQIVIKLGSFAITISLAFLLRSYWALLFGTFAATSISLFLSYTMHPFRPRLSLSHWKELINFSIWLQINNLLRFGNKHFENFIVARFAGAGSVGLLSISKEIGSITATDIADPINRAAFPGYSRVAAQPGELRKVFLNVFGSIALVALPIAAGIASIAPIMVPVLLGERWAEATPIIRLIALGSIFLTLTSCSSFLFIALARQRLNTALLSARLGLLISLLFMFTPDQGAYGAGMAIFGSSLVMLPITLLVVGHTLRIRWSEFLARIYRPAMASAIMYSGLWYTAKAPAAGTSWSVGFLTLLGAVAGGFCLFSICLLGSWMLRSKPAGAETAALQAIDKRINLPSWLMP